MNNFESTLGGKMPAPSAVGKLLLALWQNDLRFKRSGWQLALLVAIAAGAIVYGAWQQEVIHNFGALANAQSATIFYMVPSLALGTQGPSLAALLVWIAIGRALFAILCAWLDMVFHKKITGRAFDWESMINVALVNGLFSLGALFAVLNQPIRNLLAHYDALVASVPTLVDLNGSVALVVAVLIGDFCFYWSHRLCHETRCFWNLGHISHHRNRNLTQMTCAIEPGWLPLQAAGGLALLLLPVASKLFTTDIRDAGVALVVLMVIDTLVDPSHSIFLYWLESKSRLLRALRAVFVTAGVHYMHHSNEVTGPHGTGVNFGARLSVWDRVFGTYAEPTTELPRTGLFDPEADLCVNPLRYVLRPYLRMGLELRRNKMSDWPFIVFGSTDYEPPNPVRMSR
ncbi:MAG: sterol desaturase family protein [Burkholderiaceae bacterium]|nr:sterol desaturase family protein [Burkholderiaceae bacterium]